MVCTDDESSELRTEMQRNDATDKLKDRKRLPFISSATLQTHTPKDCTVSCPSMIFKPLVVILRSLLPSHVRTSGPLRDFRAAPQYSIYLLLHRQPFFQLHASFSDYSYSLDKQKTLIISASPCFRNRFFPLLPSIHQIHLAKFANSLPRFAPLPPSP